MEKNTQEQRSSDNTVRGARLLAPVLHNSHFGGEVRVIEAVPSNRSARQLPPVYYAHGAGWAQEGPTIREIARQGRQAFSMEFEGARKPDGRFAVGHNGQVDDPALENVTAREAARLGELGMVIPQQQIRAAASLLAVIAERSVQNPAAGRIDALLQSESTGHGLTAAYAAPDKFRNIVLAFPGGLSGKRKGFIPSRIARDVFARRKHRPVPENDFRDPERLKGLASVRAQLKSPGFREDARALRHGHLPRMLHSLRQKDNAPGVTLVIGLHDGIFRLKDYFRNLVSSSDVDRIVIVPGGHAIGGRKDVLAQILEQFQEGDGKVDLAKPLKERIVIPFDISPRMRRKIEKLADAVDRRTV